MGIGFQLGPEIWFFLVGKLKTDSALLKEFTQEMCCERCLLILKLTIVIDICVDMNMYISRANVHLGYNHSYSCFKALIIVACQQILPCIYRREKPRGKARVIFSDDRK